MTVHTLIAMKYLLLICPLYRCSALSFPPVPSLAFCNAHLLFQFETEKLLNKSHEKPQITMSSSWGQQYHLFFFYHPLLRIHGVKGAMPCIVLRGKKAWVQATKLIFAMPGKQADRSFLCSSKTWERNSFSQE